MEPSLIAVYRISRKVAAHVIDGETILMPTVAGVGGEDGEFFRLNGPGHAVWAKLDGRRTLASIIEELAADFRTSTAQIQPDVLAFVADLLARNMIHEEPA